MAGNSMSGRSSTPRRGKLHSPATVRAMNSITTGTGLRMLQVTKFILVLPHHVDAVAVLEEAGAGGDDAGAGLQAAEYHDAVTLQGARLDHLAAHAGVRLHHEDVGVAVAGDQA